MGFQIDPSTDLASIAERIGVGGAEELRSSTSRREPHLQKYARIIARNPDINLSLNPDRARANIEIGDEIYIPTKEFPQPVTDVPRRTYDLLCQETLTTHEAGHVRFSDWPSLEEMIEEVGRMVENDDRVDQSPKDWKATFKDMWNAAEDGVIENEMSKLYNVRNQFDVLNANLTAAGSVATPDKDRDTGEAYYPYSMKDAIVQCIIDESVHDSGKTERILDEDDRTHTMALSMDHTHFQEVVPEIREFIPWMKRMGEAPDRNREFFRFFRDELYPRLVNAEVSGVDGADADGGMESHRSDDASPAMGEAQESLSEGSSGRRGQQSGQAGSDDDGGGDRDLAEAADEAGDRYDETLQREAREAMGEGMMDEIETFQNILGGSGATEVHVDSITIPDGSDPNPETVSEAKRIGRQIAPIIQDRLREAKTNSPRRRKSFGDLDKRSMIDAERGSLRVFKRQRDSEEKDYSCVLILDRSGSMSGSIQETEISVGAFMYALEECGVDVMCLDFCGHIRLAKPFGGEVDEHKRKLFTGECGGGTPLAQSLFFARERVNEGAGTHPFIMVMTDGQAGNPGAYQEQLEKTSIPVIGLYLDAERGNIDEAPSFHRVRPVGRNDNLATVLRQLAGEVLI